MSTKTAGLAAFMSRKNETAPRLPRKRRRRGKGSIVALTVRLAREDWERMHQLAVSEGVSLQELATRGFSMILARKGLPPLRLDLSQGADEDHTSTTEQYPDVETSRIHDVTTPNKENSDVTAGN